MERKLNLETIDIFSQLKLKKIMVNKVASAYPYGAAEHDVEPYKNQIAPVLHM
jgi:hypothetical protein